MIGPKLSDLSEWPATRKRILERDNYICYLCGESGANSADHVIARMNGGSDSDDNLRAAHVSCNSRKGTK